MGLVLCSAIIAVVLMVIWIYQFTFFMMLEDSLFPGRHDKMLWCAAFLLMAGLAPFAFLMWRKINEPSAGT